LNDQQIYEAIKERDASAINYAMNKYAKLLWKIADGILSKAASEQDVEECVADVFIYLWDHPDRYDPQRGKLKTWLTIIARTKAIDRFRILSRHQTTVLDETILTNDPDIADAIIVRDECKTLSKAIDTLEEPEHEIILRRYYYDQKPKEIAFAMNFSVKQVENYLYRAKLKLRKSVGKMDREA